MNGQYMEVGPREVVERIKAYRVIDVREPNEFRGPLGHIEGASLFPLSRLSRWEEEVGEIAFDLPLLLVCRSGRRSGAACESLGADGYEDVSNLEGGMIAWNLLGLPVHKQVPSSLTGLVSEVVGWAAQVRAAGFESEQDRWRRILTQQGLSIERPCSRAVESLIQGVELSFSEAVLAKRPPDLELSVASFRRSLSSLSSL